MVRVSDTLAYRDFEINQSITGGKGDNHEAKVGIQYGNLNPQTWRNENCSKSEASDWLQETVEEAKSYIDAIHASLERITSGLESANALGFSDETSSEPGRDGGVFKSYTIIFSDEALNGVANLRVILHPHSSKNPSKQSEYDPLTYEIPKGGFSSNFSFGGKYDSTDELIVALAKLESNAEQHAKRVKERQKTEKEEKEELRDALYSDE